MGVKDKKKNKELAQRNLEPVEKGTAFLDAVRAASLVPENGTPPTYKWFESIFAILRIGKSLELTMASFKLLNELDKRFPRVHLSVVDEMKSTGKVMLIEAWSPFVFSSESTSSEGEAANNLGGSVDSSGFQHLIEDLADATAEPNFQASETKSLGNMLLFQYLVNVLEGDFQPRNCVYAETANWVLLRESLLNMLLNFLHHLKNQYPNPRRTIQICSTQHHKQIGTFLLVLQYVLTYEASQQAWR